MNNLNAGIENLICITESQKEDLKVFFSALLSTMDSCENARYKQSVPRKYHKEYVDFHAKHIIEAAATFLLRFSLNLKKHRAAQLIHLFENEVSFRKEELMKEAV